jgi:starvation-inducible outer membrane lipoprotein
MKKLVLVMTIGTLLTACSDKPNQNNYQQYPQQQTPVVIQQPAMVQPQVVAAPAVVNQQDNTLMNMATGHY